MSAVGPVTLLYTDLVNSAELPLPAGDQSAQRAAFRVHQKLVKTTVLAHGGSEVKWLGDGFMTAFVSTADAVRCAVAMQQGGRRRAVGARQAIRIGLHAAEVLREGSDYFGAPVAIARRLCTQARPGQILCSSVVAGLLVGRQAFSFRDCGALEAPGIATPIGSCEILYQQDAPAVLLAHMPFVGRAAESERLAQKLIEIQVGNGGVVMLAGEPGIGKTRTIEELAESAREQGVLVLSGRCIEGEWAPPYGPIADALAEAAHSADPEQLRADLGLGAGPLARLVPALREKLPDIPEPVALQSDEERFRLLDAVAQYLIAVSTRVPVVVVLDDLHWADQGTIAVLRHLARLASRHRLLVVGAYRDVDVEPSHPLAAALGALPRETSYEHLALKGLAPSEVQELIATITDPAVARSLVTAISAETSGNPFFIREVLLHLVEEGKIFQGDGRWAADLAIRELGIPDSVRQVIGRRLARLSEPARRLLSAAAGFGATFRFDIAARVAGLEEAQMLDAVDEAVAAHLLTAASSGEHCDFTHALVRHTLYEQCSPFRRPRLHRQIAEAMEAVYGDPAASSGGAGLPEHAGEIAEHYHRSAALSGAERGGEHALLAAAHAEAIAAPEEAVRFLRIALAMLPSTDTRRPRILGRLAFALAWALEFDEGLRVACEAGDLIAKMEGPDAAADYLASATVHMKRSGSVRGAWTLASKGLSYAAERRDATWAVFMAHDISRREAEASDSPGIVLDTVERAALTAVIDALPEATQREFGLRTWGQPFRSRTEIMASRHIEHLKFIGEYRRDLAEWEGMAAQAERDGRIAQAVWILANVARCHTALGNFSVARATYKRGTALAGRLPTLGYPQVNLRGAADDMHLALDEGWDASIATIDPMAALPAVEQWAAATMYAAYARILARLGRSQPALQLLAGLIVTLERAPGWAENYNRIACDAGAVLWLLERTDYIEIICRNLRDKVIAPDFRCPMHDGRLALARLCALDRRYDEALEWFDASRAVLDEQGARPLRAIVDFDEALMYARRAEVGDASLAAPRLEAAAEQFRALGMTGWIRRADELRAHWAAASTSLPVASAAEPPVPPPIAIDAAVNNLFGREGEYWTLRYQGSVCRMRHRAGLDHLAALLERPHHDIAALLLAGRASDLNSDVPPAGECREREAGWVGDLGEVLDPRARAEVRQRLADLAVELEDAERAHDLGRAEHLRSESAALDAALAAALGLGGRARRTGSPAERARVRVTRALRDAIQRIRALDPGLGKHLAESVRTGTFCSYAPRQSTTWTVVSSARIARPRLVNR